KRRFAQQLAIFAANFKAVAGVRARLLATDVQLHRTINRRKGSFFARLNCWRSRKRWGAFEPFRFQILEHALASALASEAAVSIPAEAAGGVKQVRAVHPHHACL